MRKLLFLFLLLSAVVIAQPTVGDTDTPYDTTGWDSPADFTKWYGLPIYQLLSNPGGWINISQRDVDSLFNELIVYTDTTQLVIRNDTLFFAETFVQKILDSAFVASLNIQSPYLYTTLVGDSLALLRDYFDFKNDIIAPAYKEGRVWYDSTQHALVVYNDESEIVQQLGREFYIRVYNNTVSTITNGTITYLDSALADGTPTIGLSDVSDESTIRTIGIATHDIEASTYGYVVCKGVVNDLNTSTFTVGDDLYLSTTTPGLITNSIPTAPNEKLRVGVVLTSDTTTGSIFVDLEEYHGDDAIGAIYFADSSYTITLTQNVESRITNVGSNLFSLDSSIAHGVTLSGDTVYVGNDGEYVINASFSFGGGTSGLYQIYTKTNGTINEKYKASRATSNSDYGNFGFHAVLNLSAGDAITLWVINTGSATDYIARHGNVIIEQVR